MIGAVLGYASIEESRVSASRGSGPSEYDKSRYSTYHWIGVGKIEFFFAGRIKSDDHGSNMEVVRRYVNFVKLLGRLLKRCSEQTYNSG